MNWFTKWHNEIQMTMPEKGQRKAHWKKIITDQTYKDLIRSIRAFLGLVQYIQMNYPDTIIIPKTMCQDDVENNLLFFPTAGTYIIRSTNCSPVF